MYECLYICENILYCGIRLLLLQNFLSQGFGICVCACERVDFVSISLSNFVSYAQVKWLDTMVLCNRGGFIGKIFNYLKYTWNLKYILMIAITYLNGKRVSISS